MRHDDRFGFPCQHGKDRLRCEIELGADIGEHGNGARRYDWRNNRAAAKSWNHDFVALAHAASAQGDFEGQTSRTAQTDACHVPFFDHRHFKRVKCRSVDDSPTEHRAKNCPVNLTGPIGYGERNTVEIHRNWKSWL